MKQFQFCRIFPLFSLTKRYHLFGFLSSFANLKILFVVQFKTRKSYRNIYLTDVIHFFVTLACRTVNRSQLLLV